MTHQDDNFRDYLARRFPRRATVISIIELPTIRVGQQYLPNEGSTIELWHAALRLIKAQGTYDQLVAEVSQQFKQDEATIAQLAKAWLEGKESAPVDINLTNPYPGLRPFEEADRAQFFGRERWIKALNTALDQHGFVTLYGGSGSGKSSLVRAGLMPRLKKEGHAVALFTPGKNPFDSLLSMGLGNKAQAQKLIEDAQKGQLPNLFAELAAKCFPGKPLLIIMDQGEELYTRCESAEVRETFLRCLFHDRGPSTRVLIGIREDFFDRWNKTRAHDPDFGATNLSLTAPDEDDWRAIIVEPARMHGVMFEAELPDRMIERLRTARSGLPLLQFLLQKLWEHDNPADGVLNQASYDSLGGVDHALRGHVEAFIARYPGRESEIRQMLFKLVRFTRQDGQYRALSRSCPVKDLPKDLADALVGDEWRLLTTRGQAGEVELSHEVILRVWPGFEKLEQERGALHALKGDITDATTRWQPTRQKSELWAGSRLEESLKRAGLPGLVDDAATSDDFAAAETPLSDPEREFLQTCRAKVLVDRQFQKRLLIGVSVTALVMLLIAVGAGWFWSEAEKQKKEADIQSELAVKARAEALTEQARSEQLTRDVIIKSASTRGIDESLEVIRSLAKSPDVLKTWEGSYFAKRFGFAPLKLNMKELGILDFGSLKGSGLYEAARKLSSTPATLRRRRTALVPEMSPPFSRAGWRMESPEVKINGLRVVNQEDKLSVFQENGNILMAEIKHDGCEINHAWATPDRSCLMLLATELSSVVAWEPEIDEETSFGLYIYLVPLLETYVFEPALNSQDLPQWVMTPAGGEMLVVGDAFDVKGRHYVLRFDDRENASHLDISTVPFTEKIDVTEYSSEMPSVLMQIHLDGEERERFIQWREAGAKVLCVDWSKRPFELGVWFQNQLLVGSVTDPDKMRAISLADLDKFSLKSWRDESRPRTLVFAENGRQILLYPYQRGRFAVISRDTLMVEKVCNIQDEEDPYRILDESGLVQMGSSQKGGYIWFNSWNVEQQTMRSYLYSNEETKPIQTYENTFIDFNESEQLFAVNKFGSKDCFLRDGWKGRTITRVANSFAQIETPSQSIKYPKLIIQSSKANGVFILSDILMREGTFEQIARLPFDIKLAPDWRWAAHFDYVPYENEVRTTLNVVRDLDKFEAITVADKVRDFQIQWFASPAENQKALKHLIKAQTKE